MSGDGNTVEQALNFRLADQLRRYGLDAEAEQRNVIDAEGRQHQVDVLVELEDECVAVEAEFDPARTVVKDAERRLPARPLLWRGLPITRAFTLVYPSDYRTLAESVSTKRLESCQTLRFSEVARRRERITIGGEQTGSVRDLSDLLLSYWTQKSGGTFTVEQIVAAASTAIDTATAILQADPYLNQPHEDADPAATTALVWLNALLFQELLAANLSPQNMPAPHQDKSMPVPPREASVNQTAADWKFILRINWHPIFDLATTALNRVSTARAHQALGILGDCARSMAESRAIQQHDIAGRVFHRLLNGRKFLATNYTTIPASVMLAGLAFGSRNGPLTGKPTYDTEALAEQLRIVDPACGSGTLLMAALQEVAKACRAETTQPPNLKAVLEQSLYGYDVVPGAQHLTNTTLSMAATSHVLSGINVYVMPHDVEPSTGTPRLGSLDFLNKAPNRKSTQAMELFPPTGAAHRATMTGKDDVGVHLPQDVDLFISNPPFTRAGGPGNADNTEWNPLFGSVLSKSDSDKMKKALTKALQPTIGSMYAGLGSAFMALIDQEIQDGKTLAVVLPLAAVTGSRWTPFRERLLDGYQIEWVVVSHDPRHRTKTQALPGRLWVSFSESTRMAEVLIVATRRRRSNPDEHRVTFVNLRHNPDEPADAIAITRALLNQPTLPVSGITNMLCSDIQYPHAEGQWGEVTSIPQSDLTQEAWPYVVFSRCALTEPVTILRTQQRIGGLSVPITELGDIANLGPYHLQIKGKNGLFECAEGRPEPLDVPALWHHKSNKQSTLGAEGNAILTRRPGQIGEQDAMLQRASTLQLACELRHAPQKVAAVITDRKMLGVRSWTSLRLAQPRTGAAEALCVWFNSTPGLLLRIAHANRPYLGRSGVPHELARTMPVLDVSSLTDEALDAAAEMYYELKDGELQGFAHIDTDPVRQELNRKLISDVLGGSEEDISYVGDLTATLAAEPLITTRH